MLLLVCVNLAAPLVSNGEARRREFAVRHALGANRRRLVRQVVVEALLLASIGGVFGVLLAHGMLAGLLELYPRRLPLSQPVAIDKVAPLCTFALVIVCGFLNPTRADVQPVDSACPARRPAARRTLAAIEDRLMAATGVETVGAVSNLPLASAGPPDDFVIDGRAAPPPGAPAWNAHYLMATPRMFQALGVTLKRGRLSCRE